MNTQRYKHTGARDPPQHFRWPGLLILTAGDDGFHWRSHNTQSITSSGRKPAWLVIPIVLLAGCPGPGSIAASLRARVEAPLPYCLDLYSE